MRIFSTFKRAFAASDWNMRAAFAMIILATIYNVATADFVNAFVCGLFLPCLVQLLLVMNLAKEQNETVVELYQQRINDARAIMATCYPIAQELNLPIYARDEITACSIHEGNLPFGDVAAAKIRELKAAAVANAAGEGEA